MALLKKIVFQLKVEAKEFYILPTIIFHYKWKTIYLGFLFFEFRIDY